jgi:hypothetical protein
MSIIVLRSKDITRAEIQHYRSQVVATKEYRDNPILLLNGVSFIAVPYKDLIFLATTKTNVNAVMAIQFLYHSSLSARHIAMDK